jgi:hypothetical protein
MTETEELKLQLVAVLSLSQEVENTGNWQDRKHALEDLQRAIQDARPILIHYAADLMAQGNEEPPVAWQP